MIREDWVEVELNEICDIYTGTGFPKKYQGEKKGKYPFYKVGDISKNVKKGFKVLKLCDNYIEDDIVEKIKGKVLPKDSVVFAKIGEALKLNRRALTTSFCLIDNNVTGVKFKDDGMSPLFLYYIFLLVRLEDYSRATTVPSVRKTDIEKIKLPLVPVPEQRAIVAKIEELFSELDSGIESLKKAKEQLEIYRQAVLKAAFEGKLTREWRIEKKYTEKYLEETKHKIHEFNSNKEGQDIPRRLPTISFENLLSNPFGWLWIEAHKVCQSVRDGTHDTPRYVKEGIPLITSKNLKKGNIDFGNVNYISLTDHKEISNRSKVEKNDILFGMIGTIGNPVIVKENNFFSIKNVGLFKKNEDLINPKYLYYYLSSWFVEKIMLDQELIRGTTQKFIALGGLRMLPIPLPSIDEQEEIIKEIESRLSVCENIEANIEEALEKAEALRQSILKKAFEGKLLSKEELEACKQEEDWEPAEDLLKRIKEANKEVN